MDSKTEKKYKDKIKQQSEQLLSLSVQRDQAQKSYEALNKQMVARIPKSPFSDRNIADAYQDLCDSIEDWVDVNCEYLESFATIFDRGTWSEPNKQLLAGLLDNGAIVDVARTFPPCSTHVTMRAVMRFLFEKLLRRSRWLLGMSEEQESLLNQSFGHLLDAFPAKGADSRAAARSEFYTSLTGSGYLQDKHSGCLDETTLQLLHVVTAFADEVETFDQKGLRKIIDAAAELADMIRLCPVTYYLIHGFAPQMATKHRRLGAQTFATYTVIDAKQGRSVRSTTRVEAGHPSVEGEVVCTIFPALVKATGNDGIGLITRGLVLADVREEVYTLEEDENSSRSHDQDTSQYKRAPRVHVERSREPDHESWASIAGGSMDH